MKEPIPIQQWLPAGPLRDMGEKYVSQLPDVAQNPIGPESLMHQSDHSWSEYLVAYSANRELCSSWQSLGKTNGNPGTLIS